MNFVCKAKCLTLGAFMGSLVQFYLFAKAETRFHTRREEMSKFRNLLNKDVPIYKPTKRNQDFIFTFLFTSYMEYMVGLAFLMFKLTVSDEQVLVKKMKEQREKIVELYQTQTGANKLEH